MSDVMQTALAAESRRFSDGRFRDEHTMTAPLVRLTTALADRYSLERELGQGGMAMER